METIPLEIKRKHSGQASLLVSCLLGDGGGDGASAIGLLKTERVESMSRVWTAMSMTDGLLETTTVGQFYFIIPGIEYIHAFRGVAELVGHNNTVPNYYVPGSRSWSCGLHSSAQGPSSDKAEHL